MFSIVTIDCEVNFTYDVTERLFKQCFVNRKMPYTSTNKKGVFADSSTKQNTSYRRREW